MDEKDGGGDDDSATATGGGGAGCGTGGFVSLFSLHDLPDIVLVDMNNVALKLKSQDPHLRLEALNDLTNVRKF